MGSEPTGEEIDEARKASARNAAGLLAAGPKRDMGQCQELDTETMKRCAGRMVATYIETSHALTAYPVWVCSVCGGKIVP